MKTCLLALGLMTLAACDTVGFGTSIELGSGGTSVTNTVSGTSGNVTGGVSIGL
jgi:hypothetical protein